MKQIKTFSLAFTYVGCFLGAGFISGQELWQFFGAFGNWGYVGFVLAALLFTVIGILFRKNRKILQFWITPSRQHQIRRIIAAKRNLLFQQPVRKSTISHFSMTPWTDPQEYRKIQFFTDIQEFPDIPASGKIIHTFLFLVMDPECIS